VPFGSANAMIRPPTAIRNSTRISQCLTGRV
jgi:hypothetical protein